MVKNVFLICKKAELWIFAEIGIVCTIDTFSFPSHRSAIFEQDKA